MPYLLRLCILESLLSTYGNALHPNGWNLYTLDFVSSLFKRAWCSCCSLLMLLLLTCSLFKRAWCSCSCRRLNISLLCLAQSTSITSNTFENGIPFSSSRTGSNFAVFFKDSNETWPSRSFHFLYGLAWSICAVGDLIHIYHNVPDPTMEIMDGVRKWPICWL